MPVDNPVSKQIEAARILFGDALSCLEKSTTGQLEAMALNVADGDNDAADDAKIEYQRAAGIVEDALWMALRLTHLVRDE